MKRLLTVLGLALAALGVSAQNSRVDFSATTVSSYGAGQGRANQVPLLALPGAAISFYSCSGDAAFSCTTLASTYNGTSSTTACPTSAQVVLQGSAVCTSNADNAGNFGTFLSACTSFGYAYTIQANGVTYGPYRFTVGCSGSSSGVQFNPSSSQNVVQPSGTTFSVNNANINKVLSVTSYGADLTGIADSTTAINAAIAAASPGTSLFFPAGTYKISGSGIVFSGSSLFLKVYGAGFGTSTLNYLGSGNAMTFMSPSSAASFAYVTVSDLSLNGSASTGGTANGIRVANTGNIDLDHVQVSQFPGDGLQLDSAQYMNISNSTFSTNGTWGMDLWPPRANSLVLNNGITLIHDYVTSNGTSGNAGTGGFRCVACLEVSMIDVQFQNNQNYGQVDTGDNTGAVGGLPAGTITNIFSTAIRSFGSHFEFNTGKNHYIQQAVDDTEENSLYASSTATGGDYYVENNSLNVREKLINPRFITNGPYITVLAGNLDEIDTGNVPQNSSGISIAAVLSRVYQANTQSTNSVVFDGSGYRYFGYADNANVTDIVGMQGPGVSLKALNTAHGIDIYPQGTTFPFTLVQGATAFTQQNYASLPNYNVNFGVFGASGSTHSNGIVPDPGGTGGSTRFLREDGTWAVPTGGGGFTINSFTGGSTVEIGATVTNPAFTASYSSTPTSAQITNTDGTSSPTTLTTPFTSGTVTGSFSHTTQTPTVFTLSAVSGSTYTATTNINFLPRTFYGGGSTAGATGATASGTTAVLVGATGTLSSFGLGSTATGNTFSVALSSQFPYLLLTGGSHTFSVNGFTTTFTSIPITFTNANGASVSMYLYVGPSSLTGTYSIVVTS